MELKGLAGFFVGGFGIREGGGIPLLQADFGLGTFVAKEEDVLVCDERRKVLGVLERGGEVWLIVAYPAWSFRHGCCWRDVDVVLKGLER